jgi:putative transposase
VKRKRFSVEQIVAVLKQAEVGVPVAELIRQVGISEQTLYRWKKQYKGLETDKVRQFKQLQDETGRLKRLVAELTLDKTMLRRRCQKSCEALAAPPDGELFVRHLFVYSCTLASRAKGKSHQHDLRVSFTLTTGY